MEHILRKKTQTKIVWAAKLFLFSAFAFFLAAAETAWVDGIRVFGAVPMPTLTFSICLSLFTPSVFGLVLSVICGLWMDFAKGFPLGFDCLLYVFLSVGCIGMKHQFYFRKIYQVMVAVFIGVLVYGALASVTNGLLCGMFSWRLLWKNAAYSALTVPIIYGFIRRKEV